MEKRIPDDDDDNNNNSDARRILSAEDNNNKNKNSAEYMKKMWPAMAGYLECALETNGKHRFVRCRPHGCRQEPRRQEWHKHDLIDFFAWHRVAASRTSSLETLDRLNKIWPRCNKTKRAFEPGLSRSYTIRDIVRNGQSDPGRFHCPAFIAANDFALKFSGVLAGDMNMKIILGVGRKQWRRA